MMNHRLTWTVASLTLAAALVLPGCTQQNTTENPNNTNTPGNTVQQQGRRATEDMREMGRDVGRDMGIQPTDKVREMGESAKTDMKKAEHAAAVARKVPGVTRATAVVHNKDIVVGLDVEGNDQQTVRAKEQEVKRMIQKEHASYKVHVTSDKDLHGRIQTLHGNAMNGGPVEEFTHDVGMVVRDIANAIAAPFR
ncbi:YhcN/YlaJ family sporulation lipoprotein [Paenibacillus daejeonensis]|uniref:YhcN/YlaJ family sporulation lipoprotein n=1 Tax=Paenibacillus daejeonensis TaxID=135193 RepID=UPI00036CC7BB|nr:YhcN/YlaJ family sporulation lipoprotein [Paenibacillus daejeonensis]